MQRCEECQAKLTWKSRTSITGLCKECFKKFIEAMTEGQDNDA